MTAPRTLRAPFASGDEVWSWSVVPTDESRPPEIVFASDPRLAAVTWARERLHAGAVARVFVDLDLVSTAARNHALRGRKTRRRYGPFRVDAIAHGVVYGGLEGEDCEPPRWRVPSAQP